MNSNFNEIYEVLEKVFDRLIAEGEDSEEVKDMLYDVMCDTVSAEDRQNIINRWKEERAEVQSEAVEFENARFNEEADLDDDYINEMCDYFEKQGIKYDLTEEFLDNCVISESAGY